MDIAKNASGNQACNLNQGNHMLLPIDGCVNHNRIALILRRCFIEVSIHEQAREILNSTNNTIHTGTVAVNIENIHENADEQCISISIRVTHFFNLDDTSIRWREHSVGLVRYRTRWIAKKLQHKHQDHIKRQGSKAKAPQHGRQQTQHQCQAYERPSFTRQQRMRIVVHQLRV